MKKRVFWNMALVILTGLLTACGQRKDSSGVVAQMQEGPKYLYATEKLFADDIVFSEEEFRSGWDDGCILYLLGTEELLRIDVENREVTKTVLDVGSKEPLRNMQGYVDKEGSLHILCLTRDEDMLPNGYYNCVFDAEGKLVSERNYTDVLMTDKGGIAALIFLPDGKMLVFYIIEKKGISKQILLSETGAVLSEENLGSFRIDYWKLYEDGRILATARDSSKQYSAPRTLCEIDPETRKWKTLVEGLSADGFYFTGRKDEETIYYKTQDGIRECNIKSGLLQEIVSFECASLNPMKVGRAYLLSDGCFCVQVASATTEESTSFNFFKLLKTEVTAAEKTELTFAVVHLEDAYKKDVFAYNSSQDKVKVVLKVYDFENPDAFLADVLAGNIPDVVAVGGNVVYPSLEGKGLLEDLSEYLSKDGDLSKSDFLEKSLQFYEDDGKLYAIPYGFTVSGMMIDGKYAGERQAWNFGEFREFIDALPDPKMATQGTSNQEMLYFLCCQYLDHFVDESGKKCNFRTQEFYDLLECANFFVDVDTRMEDLDAYLDKIQNGEIILRPIGIGGVHDYEYSRALFPNGGRIIGLPSEDGKGICLTSVGFGLAMTQTCGHKDEAWDFIKYMMTHEKEGITLFAFPSYMPFFDNMMEEAREAAAKGGTPEGMGPENMIADVPPATLAEIEMLQDLVERGTAMKDSNEEILEMILEEATVYFKGDKSAEQVAELIQNRVQLYLSE